MDDEKSGIKERLKSLTADPAVIFVHLPKSGRTMIQRGDDASGPA
jgi:hypothetical protein